MLLLSELLLVGVKLRSRWLPLTKCQTEGIQSTVNRIGKCGWLAT